MADLEFNAEVDHIVKECERRTTKSERARELRVEKSAAVRRSTMGDHSIEGRQQYPVASFQHLDHYHN